MRQKLSHENLDVYRVARQFAVDLYRETVDRISSMASGLIRHADSK